MNPIVNYRQELLLQNSHTQLSYPYHNYSYYHLNVIFITTSKYLNILQAFFSQNWVFGPSISRGLMFRQEDNSKRGIEVFKISKIVSVPFSGICFPVCYWIQYLGNGLFSPSFTQWVVTFNSASWSKDKQEKADCISCAKFESTKEHFEGTPFSSLHPLLSVNRRGILRINTQFRFQQKMNHGKVTLS